MTDALPDPLVPADVDLRDFAGMWLDTDRLLRSETWRLGTSDEKAAAMTLWLESWHEIPAASLPSNDRLLAKLSGAERWAKSKAHALRGWIECSDGRLYHPVVAEKALEAWIEKLASAISGAIGNAKRWNVDIDTAAMRDQFVGAVARLRAIDPQSRVLKKRSVILILATSGPESHPDITPESPPDAPKASPPDRSEQNRPDLTGPDLLLFPPNGGSGAAPSAAPPTPPPAFDGLNANALNGKAIVPLSEQFELPEDWGNAALALGFKEGEALREAERFRQYWTQGNGKGKRRNVKGWRQSWSNWLAKAARDVR